MADVKKTNFVNVLRGFMDSGNALSVADISRQTGLSHPTLSRIINRMMELDLVRNSSKIKGQQGRNACLYELNGEYTHVIGSYIDKETTHITLADFCGRSVVGRAIRTRDIEPGVPLIERICVEIDKILAENFPGQATQDCIRAIGFCVSGKVMVDGQKTYVTAADIPHWGKIEIQEYIRDRYGVRCYVEKDTTACLISCRGNLPQNHYDDVAFLNIGTGIGCSVMIKGEIYRGADGMAGEIRHMVIGPNTQLSMASGNSNHEALSALERTYGIRTILAQAYEIYQKSDSTILRDCVASTGAQINCEADLRIGHVDLAAHYGDHRITYLLHDPIMAWTSIITNIACLLAPQLIIVGGSIGVETPYIFGRIHEQLDRNTSLPVNVLAADNQFLAASAANNYTIYRLHREVREQVAEEFDQVIRTTL